MFVFVLKFHLIANLLPQRGLIVARKFQEGLDPPGALSNLPEWLKIVSQNAQGSSQSPVKVM